MTTDDQSGVFEDAHHRGDKHKETLLERAGGLWDRDRVVEHLHLSPEAVEERRTSGSLLAVKRDDRYGYPACQFTDRGVVDGLPDVLRAMSTDSGWTKLSLLYSTVLKGAAAHEGYSVLEALKSGHQEAALHAASTWGEQGGS